MLALGAGNWWMGAYKMHAYGREMHRALRDGGPAVRQPYRGTETILAPHTDAHDRYTNAAFKYEYYHVLFRGGRLLFILGTLLVGGAVARRVSDPET
jgi:hypothetical protein